MRYDIIFLFVATGFVAKAQNPAVFANQSAKPPVQPGQERHFYRAPDVIPGTLPEMRDAAYWIGKMSEPDKVVMTVPQIMAMNAAFFEKVKHPERIDTLARRLIMAKIDAYPGLFFSKPLVLKEEMVSSMIGEEIRYMRHTEYGNILGIQYSVAELDRLEGEMNMGGGASGFVSRSGMVTEAVCLRIVPQISPEFVGQPDKNRTRWDVWNLDIVPVGGLVTVLRVSKSRSFVFVLSDNGFGWVPADKVALASLAVVGRFADAASFVVCTGDRVPYFADADCQLASGWFRMGDRLPLAGGAVEGKARKVQVPVRLANGSLSIQEAWLAADADVHVGYLRYTRKNVVLQSLKLLDNIYDWTGAWMGRNHATALRDIFACFGFRLPSCGELLSVFNDKTKWMSAKTPREEQYREALSHDPFLTLQICSSGHSNLLLGAYNGKPINYDTHGYSYTDSTGRSLDIRRACVETMDIPDYFLKQDVVFVELK